MTRRILNALLSGALVALCDACLAQTPAPAHCDVDRARLLALDEGHFDQDEAGGWRALDSRPGCALAAADLLRDYRQAHPAAGGILYWHEGQLRASNGQSQEAAVLMAHARKPVADDRAGWNPYVDATIAFLRHDKAALDAAMTRLRAVKPPVGPGVPPVVDGYIEVDMDFDKSKRKIRWPINIEVVEGLERCFDKPYAQAYSTACQVPPKR